jgi:PKD repeat protein
MLLLMATGLMAQTDPNNMFISGYVTDSMGGALEGYQVCVVVDQNQILFPMDSLCALTNSNGWYYFDIPNGSVTGPNIQFDVFIYDQCNSGVQSSTVYNGQGNVNSDTVNFIVCESPSYCSSYIQASTSPNGDVTLAVVTAVGTAPFYYVWDNGQTTPTITVDGQPGYYCVTVTDANGCTITACDTVSGQNSPNCWVDLVSTQNPVSQYEFMVSAQPTGTAPFSYEWDNGSTEQVASYTFNAAGYYFSCVTVTDATGCSVSNCDTLVVDTIGGNCFASFYYLTQNPNAPILAGEDLSCIFNGSVSNVTNYVWTMQGGGITMTSYGQNPVFNLASAGSYTICVSVTDSLNQCNDSYCQTIQVGNGNGGGCQAYFSWTPDSLPLIPTNVIHFTDQSYGTDLSWTWDFGDGSTSVEQYPSHSYDSIGTYMVCLTVSTPNGQCQNFYCDTVVVGTNGGNCYAAFTNSGLTPIGYTFASVTESPNYQYQWTIDGVVVGNGYTAYAPGFTDGSHSVCLTITDGVCYDTQCQTINVGDNYCNGYITGQVYAGTVNQPLDNGMVYLITYDDSTNLLTAIDSMVIDSSNYYYFGPLACGNYLIKAAAAPSSQFYNGFIPTYHGNSPFWNFAQTVSIGEVNAQVTSDVTLIGSNNPGGPGFIGGDVTEGANKTEPGDPLSGVQVMLFDLSGAAIACTYTDANGSFGFEGLAYGSYQVYVEMLGVQTIPAIVNINENEPSVADVHILASETIISTAINEVDFESAIGQVYPNPVVDGALVRFNLETATELNMTVLDLAGRTVRSETTTVSNGENTVSVSTQGLVGGYYLLNIQDTEGNFNVTRRFMRVGQ